jgi:ubiquinone/menaquinone biosynthesis C-methylase UbiE
LDKQLDLNYFAEWGGRRWNHLIKFAIEELQKNNSLVGLDLLEIGTRLGKMAVLFSLLGAKVTGIDINEQPLSIAREEAKKWNAINVDFKHYDGDLDIFPDESFDIIFSKSVLVVVPNLEIFLKKISNKLRPNGRIVFLENGKGNFLHASLRMIKHWNMEYRHINYFTNKESMLMNTIYHIDTIKRTFLPPIYLFLGQKRPQ